MTPIAVPQNELRSVIGFLMLENLSSCEIHMRMCILYGAQNVIAKSTVNRWVQRFKVAQTNTSDESQAVNHRKEGPNIVRCRHQQTHRSTQKMPS